MEIIPSQFHPITEAHQANPPPRPDELREACRQFEAIFIRQMLEQSLTPLLAKPDASADHGGDIHRYMIADVLSESLSESGVFGIADMLQMQFQFPGTQPSSTDTK